MAVRGNDRPDPHRASSEADRPARIGVLAHTGEYWSLSYDGATLVLKDVTGLTYVERLLRRPGEEFHALDLMSGSGAVVEQTGSAAETRSEGISIAGFSDAGEMLDAPAKQVYKRRLLELREELENLRGCGDEEGAAKVESEIDFLAREIRRAVGLGGRDRRAGSTAERARINVTRAIRGALQKISEQHAPLGELLGRSIKTGLFCCYVTDPQIRITWRFSLDGPTDSTQAGTVAPPVSVDEPLPTQQPINGKSVDFLLPLALSEDDQPRRHNYWLALISVAGLALVVGAMAVAAHLSRGTSTTSASNILAELSAPQLPNKPSIAVLPFANLSGDAQQQYFSDGITDELITDLSRLPNLFVIARRSSFAYKGKAVKAQQVANELGVKYLLEGSVSRSVGRVRVHVQLVDAVAGNQVWAHRYDKQLGDIFTLQDEIVQSLIATLGLQLTALRKGIVIPQRTNNLEAYDYFLRGFEDLFITEPDSYAHAGEMLERAIAVDPRYSDAYTMLGFVYQLEYQWQWASDSHSIDKSEELAHRAIELDGSNPDAYALLGCVMAFRNRPAEAIAAGKRAIALDPNNARAYLVLAGILDTGRQPEEALSYAQRGMRLEPNHPEDFLWEIGVAYNQMGRYLEAVQVLKKANSNNPWVHIDLIYSYTELGREREARIEAAEVRRSAPNFSLELARRRFPIFLNGPEGRHYLDDLRLAGLR